MGFLEKGIERAHASLDAFSERLRSFRILSLSILMLNPVSIGREPALAGGPPMPDPPSHSLILNRPLPDLQVMFPQHLELPSFAPASLSQSDFSPNLRSYVTHRVQYRMGKHNADVRAVFLPVGGIDEMTVLFSDGVTRNELKRLVADHSFTFLTNGTFFGGGMTLGDAVGVSAKDPSTRVVRPFSTGKKALDSRIHNRFFFAIDHEGNPSIERNNDEVHEKLSSFRTFLGGLAAINLENPTVSGAIARNDRNAFIHYFNVTNGTFNGTGAYQGLNGSSRISRTGIGIVRKAGQDYVVSITVGDGRTRQGLSIFEFAKAFRKVAVREGAEPLKLAILDSGSSTLHASPSSIEKGDRTPTTLIGIRPRTSNQVQTASSNL